MIAIKDVSKKFGDFTAVDHVSVDIKEGNVFGLIGTNGAGKSTLLRMITGIYRPDSGSITIDDLPIWDNVEAKNKFCFIADEPYFFMNASPEDMKKYYQNVYEGFDQQAFDLYMGNFGLDQKRRIATFSKGMKKQLALLLGLCSGAKYLFCDETFDGLDPVMRQGIKSLMAKLMDERGLTPIIASHNLRELEDICDHVGLLHKGGVLLSKELEEMKCNIQKVQCVFAQEGEKDVVLSNLEVMKEDKRGSLYTFTIRGNKTQVEEAFGRGNTLFFESLPLSLEEIFISETEVVGYDVKKLILD